MRLVQVVWCLLVHVMWSIYVACCLNLDMWWYMYYIYIYYYIIPSLSFLDWAFKMQLGHLLFHRTSKGNCQLRLCILPFDSILRSFCQQLGLNSCHFACECFAWFLAAFVELYVNWMIVSWEMIHIVASPFAWSTHISYISYIHTIYISHLFLFRPQQMPWLPRRPRRVICAKV